MKLYQTIVAICLIFGNQIAHADTLKTSEFVELDRIELDQNLPYMEHVNGGTVILNHEGREVTLTLTRKFHCPEGQICTQVMPKPVVIRLPIKHQFENSCGAYVYIAEYDARARGGELQTLSLVDHRNDQCRYLIAVPITEVNYHTLSAGFAGPVTSTNSYLSGHALK